jgi:fructose-1,6-bisphosphatase I
MSSEVTVIEHLLIQQKRSPSASGHFTSLFHDLILSAKIIHRSVTKAGLLDILGGTGETNIQGEHVQKLDEFANRVLLYRMERSGMLAAMASEECDEMVPVSAAFHRGDYILIFDPLDGSTNIDVNINVGTIFSILRRKPDMKGDVALEELLSPGREQVAAGYFLYGTSTMLVYTTGQGVHGFTLDPSVGEFLLSHPDMRIPEEGRIYSVNEGNYHHWDNNAKAAVNYFKTQSGSRKEPCSLRYVGSLVADFHRTMIYGGIFMYPADVRHGKAKGKLRYLCEASPLAFVVENAGGAATNGKTRILDIKPQSLHERVPLFIGSKRDVDAVADIFNNAQ